MKGKGDGDDVVCEGRYERVSIFFVEFAPHSLTPRLTSEEIFVARSEKRVRKNEELKRTEGSRTEIYTTRMS